MGGWAGLRNGWMGGVEREGKGGGAGFSSLMKRKKRGKTCAVF
jgi:hypothetical protein